ncbi:response regulator transcription factor [Dactylosporangium sp. CA-139066]|uniref:response regulator transcription factor n=1 Tax=Dactylosporangium sp. CA-139066 TaxID=3239930 RepID=UPI003D917DDF
MTRLLLVQADHLAVVLCRENLDVRSAATAAEALDEILAGGLDLVLLDPAVPDLPAPALCRALRARSTAGIIVVGAGGEDDIVAALEHGADDYVAEPYGISELVARIRAVLRRCPSPAGARRSDVITAGPVALDPAAHIATVTGQPLELTLKEFQLLETLVRNPGRALGRGLLIEAVWDGIQEDSNTLNVHIKRLRSKIEPDPAAPRHLLTVRGIGFKYQP